MHTPRLNCRYHLAFEIPTIEKVGSAEAEAAVRNEQISTERTAKRMMSAIFRRVWSRKSTQRTREIEGLAKNETNGREMST